MNHLPWGVVQFYRNEAFNVSVIRANDIVLKQRNDGLWYVGQIYPDCFWLLLEKAVGHFDALQYVIAHRNNEATSNNFVTDEEFKQES